MSANPADFTINTLSGYVGVPFEIVFEPTIPIRSHKWIWNDGSISERAEPTHTYTVHGVYDVEHIVCDYSGNVYTAQTSVTATPYVKDTVELAFDSPTIYAGIATSVTVSVTSTNEPTIVLHYDNRAGGYNRSIPQRNPLQYWDHLIPKWSFTLANDVSGINAITTIAMSSTPITINDFVVGYTSVYKLLFTDQLPCSSANIWATLTYQDCINSRAYAASSVRVDAISPQASSSYVNITNNGRDPFLPWQWVGVPVPYFVTVCDTRLTGDSIMHYTYGAPNDIPPNFTIAIQSSGVSVGDVGDAICRITSNHYYASAIFCEPVSGAAIDVSATVATQSGTLTLTATRPFNVLQFLDPNSIRMVNESFDMAAAIAEYAPAHIVEKASVFFEQYLPALFGQPSDGDDQAPGARIYESIANFVMHTADVDTCDVDKLISIAAMVGLPINDFVANLPPDLKRVFDLVAIPYSRLMPTPCNCNRNFGVCETCCDGGLKCTLCKQLKTNNRGPLLDCATYTVTAGTPIVYQDNFTKLTNLLLTVPVSGNPTYPISDIDYGGITQPACSNYTFFEYVSSVGNYIETVIDWNACNTTLDPTTTYDQWTKTYGTIEQILAFYLIRGAGTRLCGTPVVPVCNPPQC